MNGIERITARIESDGQAESDRILADARAEAERITAHYREAAEVVRTELAAKNEKEAARRKERLVSAAQMEGRRVQLAAKQAVVECAYARALEKLQNMPEGQYVKLLAALLQKASVSGGGEVIFSPQDRETAGKKAVEKANAAGGSLHVAKETRPIGRGFVLREGRVEVNCTFETLVRLQKEETAGAVAKQLFGE